MPAPTTPPERRPSPTADHYWDSNLDPTNLGASTPDTIRALKRETEFANLTPDIQHLLDFLLAPAGAATSSTLVAPSSPVPVILDVGAGLGTTAALLTQRGAQVITLDISHRRLAAMRTATASLASTHAAAHPNAVPTKKIFAVKARAEALPFRTATLDGATSRAVLIHTDIPRACDEITRVLRPGAPVAFAEVMAHNPLVKLYRRTLAPREWQSITTYFTQREVETVCTRFTQSQASRYYQLSFLAFLFQYALPWPTAFSISLRLLRALDRVITRLWPGYQRCAWFVLITGKKRQP